MLRTRVLTAVVLVPLLIGAIWFLSTEALAFLFAAVAGLAAWEWTALMPVRSIAARAALVGVFLLTLVPAWWVLERGIGMPAALYAAALFWLGVGLWLAVAGGGRVASRTVTAAIQGWLVLGILWLALVYLHGHTPWGAFWVTFLLVLVWAADTGAYFVGQAWGWHRLAPRISPSKTWEGALGGGIAALLATALMVVLLNPLAPAALWLSIVVLLVIVAAVVGDLFESLLKRQCGLKDSSGILPGHGGLLDRIDSLTAAAPVLAMGLAWWQQGM